MTPNLFGAESTCIYKNYLSMGISLILNTYKTSLRKRTILILMIPNPYFVSIILFEKSEKDLFES
jgi:hypothetical protein